MMKKKKKKFALHLHLVITINVEIEVGMVPSQQRTQNSKSVSPHHRNPQVPTESDTKTDCPGACGVC